MWTAIRTSLAPALAAASLLLAAPPAAADVLSPFEAHYRVKRGSLGLGDTVFTLARDGECYRYAGEARPNAVVSLFVGKVTDESRFCVRDGRVSPRRFEHVETGDDEDSYTLTFAEGRVTYKSRAGEAHSFDAPDDALEAFVIHVAVRLWMAGSDDPAELANRSFTVVDEDEIKRYELAVRDGGRVETPAGTWDTLIVARVDDPDRRLTFWVAPALDWLPIRVEHQKRDDPVIRMTLSKLPRSPAADTSSSED